MYTNYNNIPERNENTPLFGATQAMILEGQNDAKKRVFLFLSIFFLTGIISKFIITKSFILLIITYYWQHLLMEFIL